MEPQTFYRIRFNHCDPFGHLNNSAFLDYMLNAREDHLRDFHDLDMKILYAKGLSWMVSKHEIVYFIPASYSENVCIRSSLIKSSVDSLLVEMTMWDEEAKNLKAILWTRFIHIDTKTGKRNSHPKWFQDIADAIQNNDLRSFDSINGRIASIRER